MNETIYIPYYYGGPRSSKPSDKISKLSDKVITLDELKYFEKDKPLYIGGDQTISLWTIHNSIKKYGENMFVFYLDSHPDIHTYKTSSTKNEHGMVLNPRFRLSKGAYYLPLRNYVFYGLKDIDPAEMELLLATNPEMHSVLNMPYTVPEGSKVHLCIDMDCFKLSEGVSYTFKSGYCLEDVLRFIDKVENRFDIVASEVVEYMPDLDIKDNVFNDVLLPLVERLKKL